MAEKLTRPQLLTIVTMMTGTFLIILNQTLLSPVLPVLMSDFGIDATTVQWLTSGYSLVMAVVIPLSPYLLGRFGSRKLFLTSMASFVIGSLIASMAPVFPLVMVGRIFQAVAAGLVMPMSFTIVLLEFPRERRGSAMGLVMLVVGFAPAIGPTLSGILVDTVGWRMLFVIVAVCALAVLVSAVKVLGRGPEFESITFDKLSVVLCSIGLVALLYWLSSFTKSDNLAAVIALIAGGVVLLALFAVRQLRLKVPLLRITVLATGRYRASVLVNMLNVATSTGMSVMLPLFIQNLLGFSAFITGITMLPGAVTGALVGLVAGKLFDKRGIRICAVPGICLMAAALLLMALTFGGDTSLVVVGVAYGLMFVGMQLLNTTVGTWGLNALSNEVIQHAQAVGNTLNQVAGSLVTALVVSMTAIGSSLVGTDDVLAGYEAGYHLGFVTLLVIVLINFVIVMFFIRERKGAKETQGAKGSQSTQVAQGSQSAKATQDAQIAQGAQGTQASQETKRSQASRAEENSQKPQAAQGSQDVQGPQDFGASRSSQSSQGSQPATTSQLPQSSQAAIASQPSQASQTGERRSDATSELRPDFETELVGEVMNREPYSVTLESSLRDVAKVLVEHRTSGVPVVDGDRKVVGFISDGDLMQYLATEDRNLLDASLVIYRFNDPDSFSRRATELLELNVGRIMTRQVVSVRESMPLGEACGILSNKRIKKVPVVNEESVLVGTLSRSNVVRSTLSDLVNASE